MLLKCTLTRSHPLGYGQPIIVLNPKKSNSPSPGNHELTIALQLEVRPQWPLPHPCWKFYMTWSWAGLTQVATAAVSSYSQSLVTSRRHFTALAPHIPTLTFCLLLALQCSEIFGARENCRSTYMSNPYLVPIITYFQDLNSYGCLLP